MNKKVVLFAMAAVILSMSLAACKGGSGKATATPPGYTPKAKSTASPTGAVKTAAPTMSTADQTFIKQLLSASDIATVKKYDYDKITPLSTYRDAFKLFGNTADKYHGTMAVYYVVEDEIYSILRLPVMSLDVKIPPSSLTLDQAGMKYATAKARYENILPSEEIIENTIVGGMKLVYLFTEYSLEVDMGSGAAPIPPTTIDGAEYYKVKPGQAYSTLDELKTALERYLTTEAVQKLLDMKTYVMVGDTLYAKYRGGHGGAFIGASQPRFVKEVDHVAGTMVMVTFTGNESGGLYPLTTVLKRIGSTWKIDLP